MQRARSKRNIIHNGERVLEDTKKGKTQLSVRRRLGRLATPGNSQKKVFNRMKCKVENSNTLKTRAKAACWRKAAELHTLVDTASQYDDKKELFLLIAFCSGRLPRSHLDFPRLHKLAAIHPPVCGAQPIQCSPTIFFFLFLHSI